MTSTLRALHFPRVKREDYVIEVNGNDTTGAGAGEDPGVDTNSGGGGRKPGILVVDDDAAVRTMLDLGLRHHGFAVWLAASGQESVAIYERDARLIDVVLLDVRMPRMDGPQTLAALRQINPGVTCCFISGEIGKYSPESLQSMGAASLLLKPFSLSEIVGALQQLLSVRSVKDH
jgi:CheY-like chemotaxis protein